MKKAKYLIVAGVTACLTAAALVRKKLSGKRLAPAETPEEKFLREWTSVLREHAYIFNGVFNSLVRVLEGSAKKPEKILREWCQRTHYNLENTPVDALCAEFIQPLIEAEDREALVKWAELLLKAAAAAGISKEKASSLVLGDKNTGDYIEIDGKDLYSEDEIEIINPAWYQNGELLEQGMCSAKDHCT